MKRILTAAACLLVWAACGDSPSVPTAPSTTPATLPAPSTTAAVVEPAAPEQACGGAAEGFVSGGLLTWLGSASGDGQHISQIRLTEIEECEQLRIVLTTSGGSPATDLPLVEVRLLDSGVLRAAFDPVVWTTSITDSLLEGSLVERVYVVRGMDGRLFVDAHLSRPADAQVADGYNPSHVVINLRPNDLPPPSGPVVSRSVVITGPRERSVTYPVAVTGYARGLKPTVAGFIADEATAGEQAQTEASLTQAAGYGATWGEFRLEIEEGPVGAAALIVGELSAQGDFTPGVQLEVIAG